MSILERLGLKSASPKENSSSENEELAHDANNKRFTLAVGGDIAELTYAYSDKTKVYTFNHTGVPKAFRGRGKGAALAEYAFNYALEHDWRVRPTCSYLTDSFLPKSNKKYDNILVK